MSELAPSRLVILDRDGVINEDSDNYIKSLEEWIPIPGSIEAIANLGKAGFIVAVATNQSGLARGYYDEFTLAKIHSYMHELVESAGGQISALVYCPHSPDSGCRCRKPAPGLLEQLEAELAITVKGSWFVGDTEKDIDTALATGCRPILVLTGKGKLTADLLSADKLEKLKIVKDLKTAAAFILEEAEIKSGPI